MLPAVVRRGIANHAVELVIFGLLAAFLLGEINV